MKPIFSRLVPGRAILVAAIFSVAAAGSARAHAFLARADPEVGKSTKELPKEVKLTFTEELEPAFSSVKVFDAAGKEVDGRNVHPDPKNGHVLLVSLPNALGAGTYKVVWRVVSKDTHVTEGNFSFVKAP